MPEKLEAARCGGNGGAADVLAPAVIVRGLADAVRVLAAAGGRPVLVLAPPEAARLLGPSWWVALARAARAEAGAGAAARFVLDCGAKAGIAQEALSLGAEGIVFTGPAAQAARLASVAGKAGALLLAGAPPALDMGAPGAPRRLAAWLGRAA